MSGEITLLIEVLATDLADERSLSCVQPGMASEVTLPIEALAADLAVVFRIISPRHDVCPVPGHSVLVP